jgi:lysophospholipase L1-like esterase
MKNQIAAFVFFVAQSSASAQTPIIPVMTSNSAPSGIASASSELNLNLCGQQKAWSAMDGNANTAWFNSGSPVKVGWVQYGFSTPQTAASYSVTGLGSCGPMTAARAPTEWQLICQDTGAVLDSRSGVSWTSGISQSFTIAAPVACSNYRLNISNNGGDATYVQLAEWQLFAGATPPPTTKTLACEGDSQTAPRLAVTADLTWCAKLAARLGWNFINYAVGGSKSADVIARLPTDLASQPDSFVVMIGANDAYTASGSAGFPPELTGPLPTVSGVTLAQFRANLMTIANTIRAKNVPVAFMTPWPFSDAVNRVQFQFFVDAMKDVGAFIGVPVVDVHGMAQGSIWWNYQNDTAAFYAKFYVDTEHPTAMAHAYMAELFRRDRFSAACAH